MEMTLKTTWRIPGINSGTRRTTEVGHFILILSLILTNEALTNKVNEIMEQ